MVKVIRKKIKNQLCKIYLYHFSDKNSNIRASININIFYYLKYKTCKYSLDLIASHTKDINITAVLLKYISIFIKILELS